jgi:flagellar assembly factor FliW
MTTTALGSSALDVSFTSPPPGLQPHTAFRLEPIAGADGLYALRAVDADLRLFLLEPLGGAYGFEVEPPPGALAEVGAEDVSEVRLLVVANPTEEGVYVNLRAPIVVHRGTGRALQAILEDPARPIRLLLGAPAGS